LYNCVFVFERAVYRPPSDYQSDLWYVFFHLVTKTGFIIYV